MLQFCRSAQVLLYFIVSANLAAIEVKVCKNIEIPIDASVTIERLFDSIPDGNKKSIFSAYQIPILFSLKINSVETPVKYLKEKNKLEIAENTLSKFYESKHKEINKMKEVNFIGKFGIEEDVLLQNVITLISEINTHRRNVPIGVELKIGAKCKGWSQYNFFQQDSNWILFEVFHKMSALSGSDCYAPTEICNDTFTIH